MSMSKEDIIKVKMALGTGVLNQMTLNHLLDSAKVYATKIADDHYEQMTDEEREGMLERLKEQEKAQENQ